MVSALSFNITATLYVQDLHCATVKRYDSTVNRITDLMNKTEEYQDSLQKMQKHVEIKQSIIADLQ